MQRWSATSPIRQPRVAAFSASSWIRGSPFIRDANKLSIGCLGDFGKSGRAMYSSMAILSLLTMPPPASTMAPPRRRSSLTRSRHPTRS